MLIALVRRAKDDINASAIGLPTGNPRCEVIVSVLNAPVVLFLELVFDRVRSGIAPQPELFDELLALLVGLQAFESRALFIRDDVRYVFVQPFLVRGLQLLAELLLFFLLLLFGKRLGKGLFGFVDGTGRIGIGLVRG